VLAVSAVSLAVAQVPPAPPGPASATINVTLPADALLTVDGQATRSTSAHRLFITPPLQTGKSFRYTFTAQFVREGKTITVTQAVFVRAGRETTVSFDLPGGYRSTYGADAKTDSYYSDALPPTSATRSEDRSYSPGFNLDPWRPNPSDPFYHGSEW
jgi:uncharacterized protein (TIGR03000 family)